MDRFNSFRHIGENSIERFKSRARERAYLWEIQGIKRDINMQSDPVTVDKIHKAYRKEMLKLKSVQDQISKFQDEIEKGMLDKLDEVTNLCRKHSYHYLRVNIDEVISSVILNRDINVNRLFNNC